MIKTARVATNWYCRETAASVPGTGIFWFTNQRRGANGSEVEEDTAS